jgi:hypothetical protein
LYDPPVQVRSCEFWSRMAQLGCRWQNAVLSSKAWRLS